MNTCTIEVPSVGIVILNWNGWSDTIQCLDSLMNSDYRNFSIVVVDNGSTDGSVVAIDEWLVRLAYLEARQVTFHAPISIDVGNESHFEAFSTKTYRLMTARGQIELHLLQTGENLGFAKGSNVGLRYCLFLQVTYCWLLNNDTVVFPNSLGILVHSMEANLQFDVMTPKICYYDRPDLVWNCGGKLTWFGSRTYYYGNQKSSKVPKGKLIRITFITGCALFLRSGLLQEVGFLTERFFFGEEDVEYSYRLRKNQNLIACCSDSLVLHKVGTSVRKNFDSKKIGRIYLHYLNRFVGFRDRWSKPVWNLWRIGSAFYILPMLVLRYRLPIDKLCRMYLQLLRESSQLDSISKVDFERIMTMSIDEF